MRFRRNRLRKQILNSQLFNQELAGSASVGQAQFNIPAADQGDFFQTYDETSPHPFASAKASEAFEAMKVLYDECTPCLAYVNPETGLPGHLYGNLHPAETDGRPIDVAEFFLRRYELALTGLPQGTRLRRISETSFGERTQSVTFAQTNSYDIPIYNSYLTCSFIEQRLSLVTNALYPVLLPDIDRLAWGDEDWLRQDAQDKTLSLYNLPWEEEIRITLHAPPDLRSEAVNAKLLGDRWILPYYSQFNDDYLEMAVQHGWWNLSQFEEKSGYYRPVWRVVIMTQDKKPQLALVDAETKEVLILTDLNVHAPIAVKGYLKAIDAATTAPKLSELLLDYGDNINSLAQAHRVHIGGPRFAEPQLWDGDAQPNSAHQLAYLTGTLFFHTRKIQDEFMNLLNTLGLTIDGSLTINVPNPLDEIHISLTNDPKSAEYNYIDRKITFGLGVSGLNAVVEPGNDCDVIYHEFCHALLHYMFHTIFTPSANQATSHLITQTLNEGLAYYFACHFNDDPHWGEAAYEGWIHPFNNQDIPWRHLDEGYSTVSEAITSSDPAGVVHAVGVWWGRVFWRLRQSLGPDTCNLLIFKALNSMSSPISQPVQFALLLRDSAENTDRQQVINILNQFQVL